jgi:hypothetical protein
MSKQAEADLILKLYEIRREETMRKARDWFFRDFHPDSMSDVEAAMRSEQSAYLRMVTSYWEMAAALVRHGAIDADLFNNTNAEHYVVYAKLQPLIDQYRAAFGPTALKNVQEVIEDAPGGKERLVNMQKRLQGMRALAATNT